MGLKIIDGFNEGHLKLLYFGGKKIKWLRNKNTISNQGIIFFYVAFRLYCKLEKYI